jgi:3'-5' exoribonuclease
MARIFICDWCPNQLVEGVFTIQNLQLGVTKNGKPFLKCLIVDKSGRSPGRMWNASEELFASLPTDGFVYIQGQTQPYQGEMQIIIQHIEVATPSPDDLLDLLPSTKQDIERMFADVKAHLEAMSSPSLKTLANAYLNDAELMTKFRRVPAAMQLHHAYLGGLLEHTWSLMRLADVTMPLYPQVNKDLVMMGVFLHDLGKCEELTWEAGFGYSDDGQLIGHVARGVIWLEDKVRQCAAAGTPIPAAVSRVLQHIILSHHGQPEFGALKIPATPEAIVVNLLDNLDAKTHMAIAAARGEDAAKATELGGNFTEKVWALNTRIYRPDPTAFEREATQPLAASLPPARPAAAAPAPAPRPVQSAQPPRPAAPRPPQNKPVVDPSKSPVDAIKDLFAPKSGGGI